MKGTRSLFVLGMAALIAAAPGVPLRAHALPLEVLTYIKAEGDRLRVLVRVPTEFLREARLPIRKDGYLDLGALQARTGPASAVVSDVTRNLDVMHEGQPLPAPLSSWTISRRPDASFDSYEGAVARIAAPPLAAEARIDPAAALVDIQLDFPIAGLDDRFSIRVNGFRANRPSRMHVRSITTAGATRTLITTGVARRVELEPHWYTAAQIFAMLAVEQLTRAALPLLLLLALAIPQRPMRTTLAAFGAFAISWTVALTTAALLPGPADQPAGVVLQRLAAAVLLVAALQNITVPRFTWVKFAAAGFGLVAGFDQGLAYRPNAPLAGAHALLSLFSFAAPILLGWLWLLVVAQAVVGLVHRLASGLPGPGLRLPALRGRWALVLLSAIVIHAALHGILVGE